MIDSFYINGRLFCTCDKEGIPTKETREKRRKINKNETRVEKDYIMMMKNEGTVKTKREVKEWFLRIFGSSFTPSYRHFKSLSFFFGQLMNDMPPREAYRRLSTLGYWLYTHFDKISEICASNEIIVKMGNENYTIRPPLEKLTINQNIFEFIDLEIGDLSHDDHIFGNFDGL